MSQKLNLVVIDSDPKYRKAVRAQASEIAGIDVVGDAETTAAGAEILSRTPVDVVILELPSNPQSALEAASRWMREHPGLQVFASSMSKSPELILSAMRAECSEFLSKPLEIAEFRNALEKAQAKLKSERAQDSRGGRVVAVYSKKGGQGVTTVAVNLAVALAERESERTALIDMAPDLGDVASHLDVRPQYTYADLIDKNQKVDRGRVDSCLTRHGTGVYYFGERESFDGGSGISPDHVRQFLGHLREGFQNVVIDVPHSVDQHTQEAFDAADLVLLVAVPDIASVRATKYTLKALRSAGYDDSRIKIVLNRVSRRDEISPDQFAQTIEHPVAHQIANDYPRVNTAINAGEPFVLTQRKSDVARGIFSIAEALRTGGSSNGSAPQQKTMLRRTFGS